MCATTPKLHPNDGRSIRAYFLHPVRILYTITFSHCKGISPGTILLSGLGKRLRVVKHLAKGGTASRQQNWIQTQVWTQTCVIQLTIFQDYKGKVESGWVSVYHGTNRDCCSPSEQPIGLYRWVVSQSDCSIIRFVLEIVSAQNEKTIVWFSQCCSEPFCRMAR